MTHKRSEAEGLGQTDVPAREPLPPTGGARVLHDPKGGDQLVEVAANARPQDLLLRKVSAQTAAQFRAAAGARGLTHAEYLAALVLLHEAMRELAPRHEPVASELARLGLSTVVI